jgi:potassium efflux system protein
VGFGQLGLDWSKLQWIVAALGVGLGFGLQEIVANFVSGIIILFERPVRVGDTVTIGTLSGTVSNIKIRATTITDFDNREVLLPNKSIITENVTNWTLNDAVTRLVLSIGVAYGSDVEMVRKILFDVLSEHPDVLKTPPPTVFFMAHGDSSLNFELRLFVEAPVKRLPVTHDVNAAINAELNRHGIEIPFPQRDVHIKEAKPQ